jgi:hypothetical protein
MTMMKKCGLCCRKKASSWISNRWIGLDFRADPIGLLGLDWINMPILHRLESHNHVAISSHDNGVQPLNIQEDSNRSLAIGCQCTCFSCGETS